MPERAAAHTLWNVDSEVKVSDFPFLVTTTVSVPLAAAVAGGVYVAVMVQSEQSGFGPISYFSIAALISLRRRSQLANEVSRVPSANRNGSVKGRMIVAERKLGRQSAGSSQPCSQHYRLKECSGSPKRIFQV